MKNYYKQGDIILVNYPYTNFLDFKVRPALVLRDQTGDDVILMGISTTAHLQKQDLVIKDNYYDDNPLPLKSAIRVGKIATIHKNLVLKKVACLKPEFFKQVQAALFRYLS